MPRRAPDGFTTIHPCHYPTNVQSFCGAEGTHAHVKLTDTALGRSVPTSSLRALPHASGGICFKNQGLVSALVSLQPFAMSRQQELSQSSARSSSKQGHVDSALLSSQIHNF